MDTIIVTKRRRRSDRNHVIYELKNNATSEIYIGITVCTGRAVTRSLKERWKRHVHRALNESREWKLCEAIRMHGPESFEKRVIEVIKGKPAAHRRERELIKQLLPALNTF